jgi:predicted RNA-binding Zn ribbon-like protein
VPVAHAAGPDERDVTRLERIGGHVALDLVNTVGWRLRDAGTEWLPTYATLLTWSETEGLLTSAEARRLGREAARDADRARAALVRARELREAMYRIGFALTHARVPPEEALDAVHAARVEALAKAHLASGGQRGWRAAWERSAGDLARPIWPVAVAAAELLESGALERLRMCEGEGCGWLFLDGSRNHSRRWCSSGDCGNRERVRRFQARRGSRA